MDYIQIYKVKSDSRTREYLKEHYPVLVELSGVQKEKLKKLEVELTNKDKEGKKTAEKTGIPENIATLDVVKIAMMLGLIKSKAIRDGKEPDKTFSILDLFKPQAAPKYEKRSVNFKEIPFYFSHSSDMILEEEKLAIISKKVKDECEHMAKSMALVIKSYKEFLSKKMVFTIDQDNIESFKHEAISIINDLIDDIFDDGEGLDEILELISILRNHLLGIIPMKSYKKLVKSHIALMRKLDLDNSKILSYLSGIDALLVVYENFHLLESFQHEKMFLYIQIRCFTKDQHIQKFSPLEIESELCIPSLVFIHAQDVIQYGLIGPYNNNSIGYLKGNFYILKEIKNDVRLWVIDNNLTKTTDWLRKVVSGYIVSAFKTLYVGTYKDNVFRKDFLRGHKYFHMLIVNLLFLNSARLNIFLRNMLQKYSTIIPTEIDMFNSHKQTIAPESEHFSNIKTISLLFDNYDEEGFKSFLEILM